MAFLLALYIALSCFGKLRNVKSYTHTEVESLLNSSVKHLPFPVTNISLTQSIEEYLNSSKHIKNKYPLLCCTLIEATDSEFRGLHFRMKSSKCHWAVLVFRGNESAVARFEERLVQDQMRDNLVYIGHNLSRVDILYKYAEFDEQFMRNNHTREGVEQLVRNNPYVKHMFPKPLLISTLIPIASQYEYVWIFDGDITPGKLDINRFLKNIRCAFSNALLVSQPLIAENTQIYKYLNFNTWEKRQKSLRGDRVIAQQTHFIEIQAPIFNGKFLEFFLSKISSRILWSIHTLGVDSGYDNIFCSVAREYAIVLAVNEYKDQNHISMINNSVLERITENLSVCGVIVDGMPIHHKNNKLIEGSFSMHARHHMFWKNIDNTYQMFSNYFVDGNSNYSNPFKPEVSKLKNSTQLKC